MKQWIKFGMMILLAGISLPGHTQTGAIRINQLGYYPDDKKIALVVNSTATTFEVVN